MATQLTKNAQNVFRLFSLHKNNNLKYKISQLKATVTTETGAVVEKPHKVAFGVPRVILTVLPGLYLGIASLLIYIH